MDGPAAPEPLTTERAPSWYFPAGTDEKVFLTADGTVALHAIPYRDSGSEEVLRLVDDATGLLLGPTDRRLPKLGIFVGQLRGEYYHQAACKAGDFAPGALLRVVAEPENDHDEHAVAVYDSSGEHKAGYYNKQKARTIARYLNGGGKLAAVAFRGTRAGKSCIAVGVMAAEPDVLARLLEPRPSHLPPPAHLR